MAKERRYRDAVTGEYVTAEYASANPGTTVSEAVETEYDTDAESDLGVLREDATPE